jgi:RNA polymerase sigma-70 factor (ECF subfamily)
LEQPSDQELIKRVLAGERQAYNPLVERYQRAVYSLARRMLRDHDQADEVAQETFVRAYVNLKKYDRRYRFYTWIITIATNLCHDSLGASKRSQPLELAGEQASNCDPLEDTAGADTCSRIRDEIDRLPPEQRQVLLLRVDRELSYQEISKVMKIPVGSVMSRLFRARQRLAPRIREML